MRNICQKLARTLVLASTIILCLSSANRNTAFAQRLIYRVDLSHVADHYIDVTVQPLEMRPDTMIFQMPVWAPGIYSTVHYGRFIQDLQAFDSSGNELPIEHVTPDQWKIPNQNNVARLTYRIKDSHADGSSPELGLARIDANGVFANTEALFGYFDNDKGLPGTIIFTMPKEWMLATTLESATDDDPSATSSYHQTAFNFSDYESLAEAPLLIAPKFQVAGFSQNGVDYAIVAGGPGGFPIDSFQQIASGILSAETSFFRTVPYNSYLFVVYPADGSAHAIAHPSSSVYTLPSAAWSEQEPAIRHMLAATLFKTWDGERFHISQLGPVDYTTPIDARSLWFTEGVSEYYAELLQVRYGLTTPSEFFAAIDQWQRAANDDPAVSLEKISWEMCKYNSGRCAALTARGALVALLMDIEIRAKTNGRSSLDNVLLRMNREAPSGKTYDDSLLVQTISKYSSTDLTDFYKKYIEGADTLPVEAYLEKMGAGGEVPASMRTGGELGLTLALNAAGTAIIRATPPDSELDDATVNDRSSALQCGDTVCAINGNTVNATAVSMAEYTLLTGKSVRFEVLKNAKHVAVTLRAKHPAIQPDHRSELAMRREILGKRRLRRVRNTAALVARAKSR
ncbi:MAG TPA: hypothetical protein VFH95_15450 [Candidatus Kapabacteria bacterium]|nr:hypothetical protein [Candidatus Kapabacteria bacterium]